MPTSLQSLSIATLVFFTPLLLLTLPILRRHSAKKDLPWFWLFLACALRIVASSVGYVAANSPTRTEVTSITSSLVPMFLVVVFTGIVNRLLIGLGNGHALLGLLSVEKRAWVNAFALAAVVVGIIGGVRSYNTSNIDTRAQGQMFCGIAVTLVLVQFVLGVAMVMTALVVARHQQGGMMMPPGDWKLFICVVGSVPVLCVRVVFAVCMAWLPNTEVLRFPSDRPAAMAVWVVLGLVMEVAVVGLYVAGGLFAPRLPEGEVRGEDREAEVDAEGVLRVEVEKQESKVDYYQTGSKDDNGMEYGCTTAKT